MSGFQDPADHGSMDARTKGSLYVPNPWTSGQTETRTSGWRDAWCRDEWKGGPRDARFLDGRGGGGMVTLRAVTGCTFSKGWTPPVLPKQ